MPEWPGAAQYGASQNWMPNHSEKSAKRTDYLFIA